MGIINYLKTINDEISKVRIEILQNKDTEITERHLYDVEQRVFKLMDIVEREESTSNEIAALSLHDVSNNEVSVCNCNVSSFDYIYAQITFCGRCGGKREN